MRDLAWSVSFLPWRKNIIYDLSIFFSTNFPEWIPLLVWCIWVIVDHISWSRSSQRSARNKIMSLWTHGKGRSLNVSLLLPWQDFFIRVQTSDFQIRLTRPFVLMAKRNFDVNLSTTANSITGTVIASKALAARGYDQAKIQRLARPNLVTKIFLDHISTHRRANPTLWISC